MEGFGFQAGGFAGAADASEINGGGDVLFTGIGQDVGDEFVVLIGA